MSNDKQTSRRQWLAGLLRGGLLAVFGGTSAYLLRRETPVKESDCVDPEGYINCRSCIEWKRCKLPRALSVKQFLNKDEHSEKQNS